MEYKSAKILSHGLNHTAEPDKYLLSGSVLSYCNEGEMEEKKKLLFVCLGNICRSPAAQAVMQQIVDADSGLRFVELDSAGTYGGHSGDLPDPRMRMHASRRGYELTHRSRQIKSSDFERFDMILAMDDRNYDDLHALAPDPESVRKIYRMTDFCKRLAVDHIPDPYYGGSSGFEQVLDILEDACAGLADFLKKKYRR